MHQLWKCVHTERNRVSHAPEPYSGDPETDVQDDLLSEITFACSCRLSSGFPARSLRRGPSCQRPSGVIVQGALADRLVIVPTRRRGSTGWRPRGADQPEYEGRAQRDGQAVRGCQLGADPRRDGRDTPREDQSFLRLSVIPTARQCVRPASGPGRRLWRESFRAARAACAGQGMRNTAPRSHRLPSPLPRLA